MKINNIRTMSVLLIIFSQINSGCSVIGYRMGAKIDRSRPNYTIVKPENYKKIQHHRKITIYLKDNTSKVGKFEETTEKYLIIRTVGMRPRENIRKINLEEILSVEIKATNHKAIGLIIGLLLDIFGPVIFLIIFVPVD